MKYNNFLTVFALAMVFEAPAFAGNDAVSESQQWAAHLAKASSPENVKAVAFQQKAMYCEQNVKNKNLQGERKEDYMAACMSKNEAMVGFTAISDQQIASSNINEMLNQSPTGAGNK
jgi:hypothetical protein